MRLSEFDRFCGIYDPLNHRYLRCVLRTDIDTRALLRGELTPQSAVRVERGHSGGSALADVLFSEIIGLIPISLRLAAVFEAEQFEGWSSYPVSIVSSSAVSEDYVGLAVTGRCSPIDYSVGEWVSDPDYPSRVLKGQGFDLDSWDGSDFFIPEGTTRIFVTERVCSCLKRERVKNVRCVRLSEVKTSETVLRSIPRARAQLKL